MATRGRDRAVDGDSLDVRRGAVGDGLLNRLGIKVNGGNRGGGVEVCVVYGILGYHRAEDEVLRCRRN